MGSLELRQVARDSRLRDAETTDDFLCVELPLEQEIEHAQARRVCQSSRRIEQVGLPTARRHVGLDGLCRRSVALLTPFDELRRREEDDEIWDVGDVTDETTKMRRGAEC